MSNINIYDMYGDCVSDMCSGPDGAKPRGKVPVRAQLSASDPSYGTALLGRVIPNGPDECIDSGAASAYLNRDDVQAAIHVQNPGFCWAVCNQAPGWAYQVHCAAHCGMHCASLRYARYLQ
jgi:hypothetical protein